MRGLVAFSSNTGNTKSLAMEIYQRIKNQGDWSIEDIKNNPDTIDYDVILIGGWAESGNLDQQSLKFFESIDNDKQKIGLFITMGSRTVTEHGKLCEKNLSELLKGCDSLGIQLVQGKISPALIDKLTELPESVIPASVKMAMQDGFEHYLEPSTEDYQRIADFYLQQLA